MSKIKEIVEQLCALEYPNRPHKPVLHGTQPSVEQVEAYKQKLEAYHAAEAAFKEAEAEYWKHKNALESEWRLALCEEYVPSDWPENVAIKVFGKAWEDGHGDGYEDVEVIFSSLVDFVNGILKSVGK